MFDYNSDGEITEADCNNLITTLCLAEVGDERVAKLEAEDKVETDDSNLPTRIDEFQTDPTTLPQPEVSEDAAAGPETPEEKSSLISTQQIKELADLLMLEIDVDKSGGIDILEFKHAMSKNQAFLANFRIKLF